MKKLIIFVSKYENSFDGANKIKDESKFNVKILEIEKFEENKNYDEISKNDIIFFLCASPLIYDVANRLNEKGCRILNKEYFLSNFTKKDIQILLKNNDIVVPSIYTEKITQNNKFPIFCKENLHTGITIQLYNKNSQDKFFDKFYERDFYLEETVKIKDSKEVKIYYVKDKIYYKNNQEQHNKQINEICSKIRTIFDKIEIFSIDFIYNDTECYLIDFNPSSGFYATDKGRKAFIKYCDEIVK